MARKKSARGLAQSKSSATRAAFWIAAVLSEDGRTPSRSPAPLRRLFDSRCSGGGGGRPAAFPFFHQSRAFAEAAAQVSQFGAAD